MNCMIEFVGVCGSKILVAPEHVESIQEATILKVPCTLIRFSSGKSVYLARDYTDVKRSMKDVMEVRNG